MSGYWAKAELRKSYCFTITPKDGNQTYTGNTEVAAVLEDEILWIDPGTSAKYLGAGVDPWVGTTGRPGPIR